MRQPYVAARHKRRVYGSRRERANAWDVFRRISPTGGRRRGSDVHLGQCSVLFGSISAMSALYGFVPSQSHNVQEPNSNQRQLAIETTQAVHSTGRGFAPTASELIFIVELLSSGGLVGRHPFVSVSLQYSSRICCCTIALRVFAVRTGTETAASPSTRILYSTCQATTPTEEL